MSLPPAVAVACGDRIGPYAVLATLDDGGAGVVFRAQQTEPVARSVALKVLRPGRDDAAVRFAREQRILARLRDEHVVQVLDAGTALEGCSYVAMELVDGPSIDSYCETGRLRSRDVVRLFRQVCAGVQHAHHRSVVHGDLRPANLRITPREGGAVAKVVGFGHARLLDAPESGRDVTTSPERTSAFIAPEQVRGDGSDLDIRIDVYALGAVLHALLSPTTSTSGPSRRALRGDLAWIVRRAVAADPADRYASVAEFDADLGRYLDDEPVMARPPSTGDRFGKLLRRHRVLAGTGLAVLVALVTTGIGHGIGLARALERGERFDRLATVARLYAANARADALSASTPSDVAAIRTWLAEDAARLQAELPRLRATLDALRAGVDGREIAAAEDARRTDPRTAELGRLRARLTAMRRAQEVAAGRVAPDEFELDAIARDRPILALADAARTLLDRERTEFGREAEGLAFARAALRKFEPGMPGRQDFEVFVVHGLFETGRHDSARARLDEYADEAATAERAAFTAVAEHAERVASTAGTDRAAAVAELRELATTLAHDGRPDAEVEADTQRLITDVLPGLAGLDGVAETRTQLGAALTQHARRRWFRAELVRLERDIAALPGMVERLAADVSRLEAATAPRVWPDESLHFLHDTLSRALPELEAFVATRIPAMQRRLLWEEGVAGWTQAHPGAGATWEEARAAIAKADGVVAHEDYALVPIELTPQRGLVPLGMNPVTRLWEFYHLRSAWDPERMPDPADLEIPRLGEDGNIEVTEDTGIVFVLIPGGNGLFGTQLEDPTGPNYDPLSPPGSQVRSYPVKPYFIARHELTQGQWLRLSGRLPACFMGPGNYGEPAPPDLRHPVERVSWQQTNALLTHHALVLPSRMQWEFAARAKASGTWCFGTDYRQLARHDNTGDATYVRNLHRAGFTNAGLPPIEDGQYVHAPVGSFLPNPFGLFDVQGNVCEWTSTASEWPRPGESPTQYWLCGGSWQSAPMFTRVAYAEAWDWDYAMGTIGVRAARALR